MPFAVGEVINSFAESVLKAPLVGVIASNPIYTALMIALIVVMIVMYTFRNTDSDESLLVMCLRSGFWIFLALVGILFIHNKVLTQEYREGTKNAAYDRVFDRAGNNPERITVPYNGGVGNGYSGGNGSPGYSGGQFPAQTAPHPQSPPRYGTPDTRTPGAYHTSSHANPSHANPSHTIPYTRPYVSQTLETVSEPSGIDDRTLGTF